jgi:hypothetical protein
VSFESNVNIPNEYWVHVDSNGNTIHVDADLDNIKITGLPKIELADINVNVRVKEMARIDIAIKEIPDTRVHVPANYNLGLSVLGVCLVNLSLCGEAQIITEKYVPRRMELC